MKNDRHANNKTSVAETTPTPDIVEPTAADLHAQLAKIREQTHDAMIYANALAESELHDRNELLDLRTIALTNRRLIREMQTVMSQHAQIIVQQREAIDEVGTAQRGAHPTPLELVPPRRSIEADAIAARKQSDDNNVSAQKRRHR